VTLAEAPSGSAPGPSPSVRIVPDEHPDRAAHVRVGGFDGPLGLLLGLVEQRRLDILEVPLGDLAGAYLDALAGLEAERLPHISAFIGVAAQLILIKSRALLPRPPLVAVPIEEGYDPEAELRERLLEYRRFRDAGARLAAGGRRLFHREAAAAAAAAQAGARPAPVEPLDVAILVRALDGCLRLVPPPPRPPEVMPRVVTIEQRAAAIRRALRRAPAVVLQELLRGVRDRVVVAVTFLALLELVKEREVAVEQDEPFGPIRCRTLAEGPRRADEGGGDA
jgi:segregation and condensation protein A